MNRVDIARRGSKAQSFAVNNPRAFLFQLAAVNGDLSEQQLLELCLTEIKQRPELLDPIIEYWFVNNYRFLRLDKPSASPSRKMIENIKEQIRILDWRMPNGKTLGQSTGTECVKAGGWLADIGKKAGKRVVSRVFSEEELRNLLAEHA